MDEVCEAQGEPPRAEDVQGHFEALWNLETQARPLRYGEKETRESLRDLAMRMLAVFHREFDPRTQVLAVEDPFRVPLVDLDTGEVLDRDPLRRGTLRLSCCRKREQGTSGRWRQSAAGGCSASTVVLPDLPPGLPTSYF